MESRQIYLQALEWPLGGNSYSRFLLRQQKLESYESLGARLGSTFLRRFPETGINQIEQEANA